MLEQLATTSVGLGLLAGGYILWLLTGIANAAFNTKTWSWKKTWADVAKAILMGIVVLGLVALSNGLEWYAGSLGFDISEFTEGMSTVTMIGAIIAGVAYYYGKAMRNALNFFKLQSSAKLVDENKFYEGVAHISDKTIELTGQVVDGIYQFFDQPEESVEEQKEFEEEGGKGVYYNVPIDTYNAFRNTVIGKGYDIDGYYGYQCWDGAALLWQQLGRVLQTGNGAASGCWTLKRDVNAGSEFELIWNLKDVKRGDVVVFGAGQYGHIGFADANYNGSGYISLLGQNQGGSPVSAYGGAGFNIVNVSTASFLGAFRLKKWVEAPAPTPKPTPTPTPEPDNKVSYTYKAGDTFGQVILDLGLATGHGLWGDDGDVAYYTAQLNAQGITGNIPIGATIVLTPRN